MSDKEFSLPDHEHIGTESEPGFCIPKQEGDLIHNFLPADIDSLIEAEIRNHIFGKFQGKRVRKGAGIYLNHHEGRKAGALNF